MKRIFVVAVPPLDHDRLKEHELRPGAVLDQRVVPISGRDNPNGGFTFLRDGDPPMEVFESVEIRREIASGDLKVVDAPAAKPASKAAPLATPSAPSEK